MKWEYNVKNYSESFSDGASFSSYLNSLGNEGWELTSVSRRDSESRFLSVYTVFLKRPVLDVESKISIKGSCL